MSEIYIFSRAEGFYPLEFGSDEEARANAECNPGTLSVTHIDGRIVWNDVIEGDQVEDQPNE